MNNLTFIYFIYKWWLMSMHNWIKMMKSSILACFYKHLSYVTSHHNCNKWSPSLILTYFLPLEWLLSLDFNYPLFSIMSACASLWKTRVFFSNSSMSKLHVTWIMVTTPSSAKLMREIINILVTCKNCMIIDHQIYEINAYLISLLLVIILIS